MGFDIDSIKNPQLRERLLKLKAQEKYKPLPIPVPAPAPPPAPAPVPVPTPVPVSTSLSTIDHSPPQKSTEIFFIVRGAPMGKPRMTQRDKWQKRPCVLRYREYCDKIRAEAGEIPKNPLAVHIKAFISMAESWSKLKKANALGTRHRQKPDWDNIGKAICDALFDDDSCIAVGLTEKFWCHEVDERTEVTVIYDESVLQRYGIGLDQRRRNAGAATNPQ